MCVFITFSSVLVAKWPPCGKYLLTRLTICSLCILIIRNISYFPFWFKVLIASVSDLCISLLLFIFSNKDMKTNSFRSSENI